MLRCMLRVAVVGAGVRLVGYVRKKFFSRCEGTSTLRRDDSQMVGRGVLKRNAVDFVGREEGIE